MSILFISPNSPYESVGGVERYISNLIETYGNNSRHDICIILPTGGEDHTERKGNLSIYHKNNLYLGKGLSDKQYSRQARLFSLELENILELHNIDIICAENFHIGLPPAYSLHLNILATTYKIPLILQLHSFAISELQIEIVNQLIWEQVTCISKSIAGDCFHKGTEIKLLATRYLGVNTEEFNTSLPEDSLKKQLNLPSDSKILLSASRIILGKKTIIQEKGLINLISTFSKLLPRYPGLFLVIAIGKPPKNLIDDFNRAYEMLKGYIKLHDVATNTIIKIFELHQMPQVYRGADVFILPSENETFGQVFIEAMASGLPVIGTKVGGIPEIISDNHNGYLVPPDDASILAQRIEKLLKDDSLRTSFIEAGLKTVRNRFTLEEQLFGFQHMLEQILLKQDL